MFDGTAEVRTLTACMDNVDAWRLGEICNAASIASAGDLIDRGLALHQMLAARGYVLAKRADVWPPAR